MSANIYIIQEGYSRMVSNDVKPEELCDYQDKLLGSSSSLTDWKQCSIGSSTPIIQQQASGSCCLVRSSNVTILFDTMGPWEKDLLLSKLKDLKLHPDDIDYVIGSHGHADHIGNMNLFTNCRRQFIGICSYHKDSYFGDYFNETVVLDKKLDEADMKNEVYTYKPSFKIDNNLIIKATPGHTSDDVTMIIDNCDKLGKVALVGDLFERSEDVSDESIWIEAGSSNQVIQRYNRKLIYDAMDWILPGHGPLFKTQFGLL